MPLSGFTLFIDRCLGSHIIPAALRQLGLSVEIHCDHFEDACDDAVWLQSVGSRGWIVLTKDAKILKRPAERRALEDAGVHAIFFGRRDATAGELSEAFGKALKSIDRIFRKAQKPTFVIISQAGSVRIIE